MTTSDAFTGENVRRGGFLERSQRYERAAEVVSVTRALWDSPGEPVEHHGSDLGPRPVRPRPGRPLPDVDPDVDDVSIRDRTSCPGPTLRDHFGLRHPHASSTRQESA